MDEAQSGYARAKAGGTIMQGSGQISVRDRALAGLGI